MTHPPPQPPAIVVLHHPANVKFTPPQVDKLCFEKMADAIRAVENSGERQRGAAGEWGTFQIMPQVWRRYSKRRQWDAPPAEQRRVAIAHLKVLAEKLELGGFSPGPRTLALAYNAGETKVLRGTVPRASYVYAGFAENIYREKS
jgi:hypothetical protein